MKTWTCKVCGYVHRGDMPPEFCPKCGAPKSQFSENKEKGSGCAFSVLFFIVLMMAFCLNLWSCSSTLTVDNSTVKTVDLNRYLGKWYEVARLDHRFERGMTHCTATYTMRDDGKIRVTNRGRKDGRWRVSAGKAKITKEAGVLRVSFFGPFYSDYRILMLAPDYSYALVGGSSDDYLWILSREPKLDPMVRVRLVNEARQRGYNTEKLVWVEQENM